MIILLTVAHQLNLGRAAQLRQRTRGHDLLIRDEPLKNRALQSSYPNREVLRILLPLTCGHRPIEVCHLSVWDCVWDIALTCWPQVVLPPRSLLNSARLSSRRGVFTFQFFAFTWVGTRRFRPTKINLILKAPAASGDGLIDFFP